MDNLLSKWTTEQASDLYRVKEWGAGYFDVNAKGEAVVRVTVGDTQQEVSLMDVVSGLTDRGTSMPVLLRIENILDNQITLLNQSFLSAMKELNLQGTYRGVFPIKVNQQQQVIEEISRFGSRYHHGLEAGQQSRTHGGPFHDPQYGVSDYLQRLQGCGILRPGPLRHPDGLPLFFCD
jgi:arginine decarboxylase